MRVDRLIVLLTLLWLAGCATYSGRDDQAKASAAVYPTDQDRALAAQWKAAVAAAPEAARENINHSNEPWVQAWYQMLLGYAPGTAAQFDVARDYFAKQIEVIELVRTFPPPPSFSIARAQRPVRMDGRGSDPAWQKAAPIAISSTFNNAGTVENPAPAEARLLWDSQYLYVLFTVYDSNVLFTAAQRDDPVWEGSCVEMFVLPSRRWGQYWEMNIAPNGVVYDNLLTKFPDRWGGIGRPEENLAGLKVVTTLTAPASDGADGSGVRGYVVELAIPWSELPGMSRTQAGDKVFLVLGQAVKIGADASASPRYFCHAPILAWFHNIWGYSEFTLED